MSSPTGKRTLRIIGGNWRSRKVSFPDRDQIRPTPDRVRETVFNWLQYDVAGARCLELYAGSGLLGMEALSRGAAFVTFVDRDPEICLSITRNLEALDAGGDRFACIERDAMQWLQSRPRERYDIAFLDPPFDSTGLIPVLARLPPVLQDEALIYIESPHLLAPDSLPPGMEVHRQKQAGRVHFALCRFSSLN